jgi:transcriptional regulator with XRE-family HTH domain
MIKESLTVIVGRNLRRIRKEKGISIERLSLLSSVNKNYISDLERGDRNPTISVLDRIAYALKIDIKELF